MTLLYVPCSFGDSREALALLVSQVRLRAKSHPKPEIRAKRHPKTLHRKP